MVLVREAQETDSRKQEGKESCIGSKIDHKSDQSGSGGRQGVPENQRKYEKVKKNQNEKKTIILVEQNAKKGLEFADNGYVLVSGQTAIVGKGDELLENPDVGRLFLGG